MKRMACVISKDEVAEKCICTVCKKEHLISQDSDDYFDYSENGPVVGRYDGWDDATKIICADCESKAEELFGKDLIVDLLIHGELEIVDFYAMVAVSVKAGHPE